MGSGSSKEKEKSVSPKAKQTTPRKTANNKTEPRQTDANSNTKGVDSSPGKTLNERTVPVAPVQRTSEQVSSPIYPKQNGHSAKQRTQPQNLGGFESDDDSGEEDISAVLAATRQRQRELEQNRLNVQKSREESLPETYAQRLQREQYMQPGLLRQKTIYRNPDEWEVEEQTDVNENEVQAFDVSKYKEANVATQLKSRDIFTPSTDPKHTGNVQTLGYNPDSYYQQPTQQHKQSVPQYDISEEELISDIEKEYGF